MLCITHTGTLSLDLGEWGRWAFSLQLEDFGEESRYNGPSQESKGGTESSGMRH